MYLNLKYAILYIPCDSIRYYHFHPKITISAAKIRQTMPPNIINLPADILFINIRPKQTPTNEHSI